MIIICAYGTPYRGRIGIGVRRMPMKIYHRLSEPTIIHGPVLEDCESAFDPNQEMK